MLTMFPEENEIGKNCEIISKLSVDILNYQIACLLIQNAFLSLKIIHFYYDELSLFGVIN